MNELTYKAIGRASLAFDYLRPLLAGRKASGNEFDKTGLVTVDTGSLEVILNEDGVLFVDYESLAHSFWRAQEFSLFSAHLNLLKRPILDLGCGDGSFASVLFNEIEFGADYDPEALKAAGRRGIYKRLVNGTSTTIPVETDSVNSVFSNSVLEHTTDLDEILSETGRVLAPGGVFAFTVPVKRFHEDLAKYFGEAKSERIKREYYHRSIFEAEEWKKMLARHGFSIKILTHYQPDRFTFWYMMMQLLGKRGLGRFFPSIKTTVWERYGTGIAAMVRASINRTRSGGNIFVVAINEKA